MTDVNHSHGAVQFKVVSRRWGKSILFMLWARFLEVSPAFQCWSDWRRPSPVLSRNNTYASWRSIMWCPWFCARTLYLKLLNISDLPRCKLWRLLCAPSSPPSPTQSCLQEPRAQNEERRPRDKERKTNEATGKKPKEERTLLTTGVGDGEILVDAGGTGLAEHGLRRLQVAPFTALASRPHLRHRLRRLAVCAQKELTALPAGPPQGWNGLTTTCPGRNELTTTCPGRNGLTTKCRWLQFLTKHAKHEEINSFETKRHYGLGKQFSDRHNRLSIQFSDRHNRLSTEISGRHNRLSVQFSDR